MAELTEQQLESAKQELAKVFGAPVDDVLMTNMLRTAAPFLQLLWSELISFQEDEIFRKTREAKGVVTALAEFVRRRNAALMPKPVDRRLKFMEEVLSNRYTANDVLISSVAADILKALDNIPAPDFKFGFTGFKSMKEPHIEPGYRDFIPRHPDPPREEFKKNPADMPKPVDPRKATIIAGISHYGYIGNKGALADSILTALDEVKP